MSNLSILRPLSRATDSLAKNEQRVIALSVMLGALLFVASLMPDLWKFLHDAFKTGAGGTPEIDWARWLREHGQQRAREAANFLFSASALMAVVLAYLRQGGAHFDYLRILFFFRKHTVICGMSTRGMLLAEDMAKKGKNVVVIDLDEKHRETADIRIKGISVLRGDARREETLRQAGLKHAMHLVCMTATDETNLAILEAVRASLSAEQQRSGIEREFVSFCHIRSPNLRSYLKRLPFMGSRTKGARYRLFNVEESTAAELLRRYPPEGTVAPDQTTAQVHVALFGGGDLAIALAIQMAQLCHYWREDYLSESQPRTRLTIVSPDATALLQRLRQMCSPIERLLNLETISLDPEDPSASAAFLEVESVPVSQVFVALKEQVSCLAVASRLAAEFRKAPRSYGGQIVAILPPSQNRIDPHTWSRDDLVEKFESYESCKDEIVIGGLRDKLAEIAHGEYLRDALKSGAAIGDLPGLYQWSNLSEFLRSSNRQQVAHLPVKLRALGFEIDYAAGAESRDCKVEFSPEQLERLAEMEHRRWMAFYLVSGWVYGGKRNDEAREHDCLVPYCQLPDQAKERDRSVVRNMEDLCRAAGYALRKVR